MSVAMSDELSTTNFVPSIAMTTLSLVLETHLANVDIKGVVNLAKNCNALIHFVASS